MTPPLKRGLAGLRLALASGALAPGTPLRAAALAAVALYGGMILAHVVNVEPLFWLGAVVSVAACAEFALRVCGVAPSISPRLHAALIHWRLRHAPLTDDRFRFGFPRQTNVGFVVPVKLTGGATFEEFEKSAACLASHLRVMEAQAVEGERSHRCTLRVIVRDTLADVLPGDAPITQAKAWSMAHPVQVGITESGEPATVDLFSQNILVGGSPGSGKSNSLSALAAACCLDPAAKVAMIDCKGGVELRPWEPRCEPGWFADSPEAGADVLDAVAEDVAERYKRMKAEGKRKVTPEDYLEYPPAVLIVDELAEVLNSGDSKADRERQKVLASISRIARASGWSVLLSTQKPTSDVVPSAVQALCGIRIAHRTGTVPMTVCILGDAAREKGAAADRIPLSQPGTGYLTRDTGEIDRFRSWHISDAQIEEIAARCVVPAESGSEPPLRRDDLVSAG